MTTFRASTMTSPADHRVTGHPCTLGPPCCRGQATRWAQAWLCICHPMVTGHASATLCPFRDMNTNDIIWYNDQAVPENGSYHVSSVKVIHQAIKAANFLLPLTLVIYLTVLDPLTCPSLSWQTLSVERTGRWTTYSCYIFKQAPISPFTTCTLKCIESLNKIWDFVTNSRIRGSTESPYICSLATTRRRADFYSMK